MGWKTFRDHFRINRLIVETCDKGLTLGSGYIRDLFVIGSDGVLLEVHELASSHKDLQRKIEENPELVRQLIAAEDYFERSIKIYTFEGAQILEKYCEELDYPNVTHDGCMITQQFSTDRDQVIQWALRSARAGKKNCETVQVDLSMRLDRSRELMAQYIRDEETLLGLLPESAEVHPPAVAPAPAMVTARTVIKTTESVVNFSSVRDLVCTILDVKSLCTDGLGWDFYWDIWVKHADDSIVSCQVSECTVSIEGLLEKFGHDEKAVRVLNAFKIVLGEELSEGVNFYYD